MSRKDETLAELIRACGAYAGAAIAARPDAEEILATVYDVPRPRIHVEFDGPTLTVSLSAVMEDGSLQLINRVHPFASSEREAGN